MTIVLAEYDNIHSARGGPGRYSAGMPSPLRVFIVDDHFDVRRALIPGLAAAPGIELVGATGEADEAIRQVRALRPDVVLIESKRADGRGLELISWIAQSGLPSRVVVLTSYPSEWERWACHRAGAARYLLKDIGSAALINQLQAASAMPIAA